MLSLLHFPGEHTPQDCIIHVLTCICAWAARVTREPAASCSEQHLTDNRNSKGVPCFEKGHFWYMHNVTCTAALGVNCAQQPWVSTVQCTLVEWCVAGEL